MKTIGQERSIFRSLIVLELAKRNIAFRAILTAITTSSTIDK